MYTHTVAVESTCSIDFHFEIEYVQKHSDIRVEPERGVLEAMQTTLIEVVYAPATFTHAECIVKFKTNEFENEPIVCRIYGNALPSQLDVRAAL